MKNDLLASDNALSKVPCDAPLPPSATSGNSVEIEAVSLLRQVMNYRKGNGKYNFSLLPIEERVVASMEAWEELESRINLFINKKKDNLPTYKIHGAERKKLKQELGKLKGFRNSLPILIDCSKVYGDHYYTDVDFVAIDKRIAELEPLLSELYSSEQNVQVSDTTEA